ILVAMCVTLSAAAAEAQGTPIRLGPVSVVVPQGWTAQTNTVPVRVFSPESNPAQFFAGQIYPPEQTPQDVRQHHVAVWTMMAQAVGASGVPRSGATGSFIWSRVDFQRVRGQTETLILYSVKTGSQYMAIAVNANRA